MFDLNVLPMNLINGRNLGELPGLQVFPAPRKSEKSRQKDVLILLITAEKMNLPVSEYEDWGKIISEGYFSARGSFTMGISTAVRKIAEILEKKYPGITFPELLLNIAVLRDRTLMIGHVGPVNTTIVCADHVDNFSDENSSGLGQSVQTVRFFQAEIHSGDLILMCPKVPHGWTNEAILDATSESPLNVIRYLLDQAHGNLQGAVIQVKAGHGEILYRYKPPITTNITLGYDDLAENKSAKKIKDSSGVLESQRRIPVMKNEKPERETGLLLGDDEESPRPLYRLRVPFETLPMIEPAENEAVLTQAKEISPGSENIGNIPAFEKTEVSDIPESAGKLAEDFEKKTEENITSDQLKVSSEKTDEDITMDFLADQMVFPSSEPEAMTARDRIAKKKASSEKESEKNGKKGKSSGKKTGKRILFGIFLGILIPIIVVFSFFYLYSDRGKNQIYRENLGSAVDTAKIALQQTEPALKRVSWEKVIEYLDEAESYGKSKASTDLRFQAYEVLESLENGRQTNYRYALANQLPKGTNLTAIESTSQYLYGLDGLTGSILRFFIYSSGLTLDNSFKCSPGTYKKFSSATQTASAENAEAGLFDETLSQNVQDEIVVKKLVDFVLLPQSDSADIVLAAVDKDANILYCKADGENQAIRLGVPPIGWLGVDGLFFSSKTLFVLDSKNESIWKFDYNGQDGFSIEPKSYFGAAAPSMKDVIDFVVYDNYSYLLRDNGALIFCDYTGYDPSCSYVSAFQNANNESIDLTHKHMIQIKLNATPDTSLYLIDEHLQSIVNISLKLNLIRYIVPNRFSGEGAEKTITAFGFVNNSNIIWAAGSDIYIGAMP